MGSHYGLVLAWILVLGLLEVTASAPTKALEAESKEEEENKADLGTGVINSKKNVRSELDSEEQKEMTELFFDSCSNFGLGPGQREIVIRGHKIKDCYNIQGGSLNPSLDAVRTHPAGLKIHLFPKENCQGEVVNIPNANIPIFIF